jgi:hypothetical protein
MAESIGEGDRQYTSSSRVFPPRLPVWMMPCYHPAPVEHTRWRVEVDCNSCGHVAATPKRWRGGSAHTAHCLFCTAVALTGTGALSYGNRQLGLLAVAFAVASCTLVVSDGTQAVAESVARRAQPRRRPSYHAFVRRRLGSPSRPLTFVARFFWRPLTAPSFGGFWAAWNPPYAYVLRYFVYRPLLVQLPRRTARYLTFLASGLLLHDLPFNFTADLARGEIPVPRTTALFAIFAVLTLVSEVLGLDLSSQRPLVRALANTAWLGAAFGLGKLLSVG